jgi:hypothetical protein
VSGRAGRAIFPALFVLGRNLVMGKEVTVDPGIIIRKNSDGQLFKGKERRNAWSAKSRAAFLDHLAATCNVTDAAKSVGVFPATPHRVKRRDPDFAAQWQAALEAGYSTLETMLIGRAMHVVGLPEGETTVPDANGMTTEMAMRLLAHHKRGVSGGKRGAGPGPRRATEEETYNNIVKKLNVLRKRIDAGKV